MRSSTNWAGRIGHMPLAPTMLRLNEKESKECEAWIGCNLTILVIVGAR